MLLKILSLKALIVIIVVALSSTFIISKSGSNELPAAGPIITFPALEQANVSALTWAEDSSTLIIGYSNGVIEITPLLDNIDHQNLMSSMSAEVTSLATSPNQLLLGVGYENGVVEVWNISTRSLIFTADDRTEWIRVLAWSPDGNLLSGMSGDGTVIWESSTEDRLTSIEENLVSLTWTDNTTLIGRGLNSISYVWDVSTDQPLTTINAGVTTAISPDGSKLIGTQGSHLTVWSLADGQVISDYVNNTGVDGIAWSPDASRIAYTSGVLSSDYTVRVLDVLDDELELTLSGHREPVFLVHWHPNGNNLISVSFDDTIRVWNTNTGELVSIINTGEINDAAKVSISPDGNLISTIRDDGSVAIWELFPET